MKTRGGRSDVPVRALGALNQVGRASPRANNFDLLRFVLAGIVVLFHVHALSQDERLGFLSRFLSPDVAVKGFFVVSGYLILRSWEGSKGFVDYAAKRVRRIYPAYAVVVLGCAFLGALVTTLPLRQYFSLQWLRYVAANLVFLNFLAPTLPAVFTGNPEATVNGALWTLKVEVMFYAAVPGIAWLIHRYGVGTVSAVAYVASITYSLGMLYLADITGRHLFATLAHQLPGQLSFFMAGALLYYREEMMRRWLLPGAVVSLCILVVGGPVVDSFLRPILLSFIVIYFATAFPHLGNFGRFGDFSYGIYIIHFPVLQWLVSQGWFHAAPFSTLVVAGIVILAAAFASWHLIERRFLSRASHYVQAAQLAQPA
jgi:peptidoglycan/LPS O-acetylase OafA/YrhL